MKMQKSRVNRYPKKNSNLLVQLKKITTEFIFWFIIILTVTMGVGSFQFAIVLLQQTKYVQASQPKLDGLPPDPPVQFKPKKQRKITNINHKLTTTAKSQSFKYSNEKVKTKWLNNYYKAHSTRGYLAFNRVAILLKKPQYIYILVNIALPLPNLGKTMAAHLEKGEIRAICPSPDEEIWRLLEPNRDVIIRVEGKNKESLFDLKCKRGS